MKSVISTYDYAYPYVVSADLGLPGIMKAIKLASRYSSLIMNLVEMFIDPPQRGRYIEALAKLRFSLPLHFV
ncbi:hypothetical protein [Pyrococcus kukulkanii]|uniref:hypothetical protein n=1 Tax=Pyrococcus kukulkanii TaxID=1609559 RepID=UPI0035647613